MTFARKRRHAPVPGGPGGVPRAGAPGRAPMPAMQDRPPGYAGPGFAGRPAYGPGGRLPAYGGHSYGGVPSRDAGQVPYGPAPHGTRSGDRPPFHGAPPQSYPAPSPYGPPAPGYTPPAERRRRREPAPAGGPVTDEDERWAVPAYVGMFVGGFVAPAIVYFAKGRTSPFARFHAVQALNLCIAMAACDLVAYGLLYVIGFTGLFVAMALVAAECFCVIRAAIGANRCEWYRLPAIAAWPILR